MNAADTPRTNSIPSTGDEERYSVRLSRLCRQLERELIVAQNEVLRLSGLLRVSNTERNDAPFTVVADKDGTFDVEFEEPEEDV